MDFIKIAICDDEKNIRVYLSSLVRKQGAECEIAEYASADEYLLDQTEYDLLFLDIHKYLLQINYDINKYIILTEITNFYQPD